MTCGGYPDIEAAPAITKLDKLPEGWKRTVGAQTAPTGWYWANNGKSLFGGERRSALIKEEACKS